MVVVRRFGIRGFPCRPTAGLLNLDDFGVDSNFQRGVVGNRRLKKYEQKFRNRATFEIIFWRIWVFSM